MRPWNIVVILTLVFTAGAFAADAVPTVEAPTSSIKEILITVLLGIASFGGIVITYIFGLAKKNLAKTDDQAAAWDALSAGVNETYRTLYKKLKDARSDGKLSEAEKKELRDAAIQAAKDIATGPALELLKKTALPILHDKIEQIVSKRKNSADVPPAISAT